MGDREKSAYVICGVNQRRSKSKRAKSEKQDTAYKTTEKQRDKAGKLSESLRE